jgi:hypothetical protein
MMNILFEFWILDFGFWIEDRVTTHPGNSLRDRVPRALRDRTEITRNFLHRNAIAIMRKTRFGVVA